jgi:hypothetical protein
MTDYQPNDRSLPTRRADSERLAQAERNEHAFQEHNTRRAEIEQGGGTPDDEVVPFLCECCNAACFVPIHLKVSEYEQAVRRREYFIVAPGHEQSDVEVVVERHRSYVVVSKADLARPAVDATLRRAKIT